MKWSPLKLISTNLTLTFIRKSILTASGTTFDLSAFLVVSFQLCHSFIYSFIYLFISELKYQ